MKTNAKYLAYPQDSGIGVVPIINDLVTKLNI